MKIKLITLFLIGIISLNSSAQNKKNYFSSNGSSIEKIIINKEALYPETLIYNKKTDKFIVGSFRDGKIYEIDAKGNTKVLLADKRLNSVLGIQIDYKHNRLLVVSSDVGASINSYAKGAKKEASLAIFDLATKKIIHFVNLNKLSPETENHLANGLTIDTEGNAYITDSFSPIIYKVDMNGNATIFLENKRFIGKGINLNGIVYHPNGYLLVVKKSEGILFKILLTNPENFSEIKIDKKIFGGDGLLLVDNNNLILAANIASGVATESVFSLKTNDDWTTAKIIEKVYLGKVYPTTVEIKDDKIYVVHSNLNILHKSPREEQSKLRKKASIQQVGVVDKRTKEIKLYTKTASKNKTIITPEGIHKTILEKHINKDGSEFNLVHIEYPAGLNLAAHHHSAVAFIYILEGIAESQYIGEPLKTFKAGDTFQDKANEQHVIFRNKNKDKSLKYLISFTTKKGVPFLIIP